MQSKSRAMPLELKSLDDTGLFKGYGSIYGNTDSYGDVVCKGAFAKSLTESKPEDIKMLWQHDTRQPIGVYKAMREDERGLYVEGQLCIDGVPKAQEAYSLLKAGAISGLSIGYMINDGGSNYDAKAGVLYLTSLKLMEVSLVTFPANTLANVESVKEIHEEFESLRVLENHLRDVGGLSKTEAKRIASLCYKAPRRDAADANDSELIQSLSELSDSIKQILKGI